MIQKNYTQQVQEMISLMKEAVAKEVLPRFGKVQATDKTKHEKFLDIVTQADIKASEYILNRVRKKFPGSYSEEHKFADRFDNDLIWQIDPVDGTLEFYEGYKDGYACLAALLKRQDGGKFFPVAGIIYIPGTDRFWYADGLGGVVCLDQGVEQNLPKYSKDILKWNQIRDNPSAVLEKFYKSLGEKLKLKTQKIVAGASGVIIANLLEGKINVAMLNRNYSKEWDIAMAEPMIRALGGFVCDLEGNDFTYNRQDVEGLGEPYNLKGYVASIVFKKEDIIPHIMPDLIENML